MTDLYWPYPDSPVSCASVSSCSSVSEMSVSPAPSPRQLDAAETETETDAETTVTSVTSSDSSGGGSVRTEVCAKTVPVHTETAEEQNANSASSWSASPSGERLDNAECGVRGVTTAVSVHYPPNPYRRSDPYRPVSSRSRRHYRRPVPVPVAEEVPVAAPAPDAAEQRRFRRAVAAGDCAAVRQMLAEGARVGLNTMDSEGWTALHRAVRGGHLEIVRLLVAHGADFRLADRDGWSPVHMASWAGHNQLVLYLLGLQR